MGCSLSVLLLLPPLVYTQVHRRPQWEGISDMVSTTSPPFTESWKAQKGWNLPKATEQYGDKSGLSLDIQAGLFSVKPGRTHVSRTSVILQCTEPPRIVRLHFLVVLEARYSI